MPEPSGLSEEQWAELREVVNKAIANGLDTPVQVQNLKFQIGRLVPHIDSQRRVEEIASKQLYEHHQLIYGVGDNPGMKDKINEFSRVLATLKKLAWVGTSMLVVLVIKIMWELAVKSGVNP